MNTLSLIKYFRMSQKSTYVMCKTQVACPCSASQSGQFGQGSKVSLWGLQEHLLHTVTLDFFLEKNQLVG